LASLVYLLTHSFEFLDFKTLVTEGLDRRDVSEGLLCDAVHVALLSLNAFLDSSHLGLVENLESAQGNQATDGHAQESGRDKEHDY